MGYIEDLLGVGSKVAAWASEGLATAQDRLEDVYEILTADPEESKRLAARADWWLYSLRCELIYMSTVIAHTSDPAAKKAMKAEMYPHYRTYVMAAAAMYGSVEAARERFLAAGGCQITDSAGVVVSEGAVGLLPALPVAAWYAAGAAVATASMAYAWSWSVSGEVDVQRANAASQRMFALGECIRKGGTVESCSRVGTPTQAESTANASKGVADTLSAAGDAGRGAGAAASGTGVGLGVAALGLAALGAAFYMWNQK